MGTEHTDRARQRARQARATPANGTPRRSDIPLSPAVRGDADETIRPGDPGYHEPEPELPAVGIVLADVQARAVDWLWPGRIPLGKLTILDGDPGLGKSVLTLELAARVTRGMDMPVGTPGRAGGVVLLTAEDGLDDTVVPRLDAAGADRRRILALDVVPDESRVGRRLPSIPGDLLHLRAAIGRMGAVLVIVDPITAYLGGDVNAHRDQDVRRALHPLAQLADDTGAAVVVVRHLNKAVGGNPLYRGGGSIGIIGAARSGLLVAADPDNPDRRILAPTKSNLARKAPSLVYQLDTAPSGALRIGWMGESALTAEQLLAAPTGDDDRDAVAEAVDVLRSILVGGSRPAKDVRAEARRAGVSDRTLDRARTTLGIRSRRMGYGADGVWHWMTPDQIPPDAP